MLGVWIYLFWSLIPFLGSTQNLEHFDSCVKFLERYFGHVLLVIVRARTSQCAHYSKCLNEVYKAFKINHISYKKLRTYKTYKKTYA